SPPLLPLLLLTLRPPPTPPLFPYTTLFRTYTLGPHEYLEHLRRLKGAVKIPIIGSRNGTPAHAWLKFATLIEQAGADALELNMRSEEHTSELQSPYDLVCRLLLEKKKNKKQ